MAGQVLRMLVNGRLTAPPPIEAVLVTNSVASVVVADRWSNSAASGLSLDTPPLGNSSGTPRKRIPGPAFLRGFRKFEPVPASQFLSASREVAPAS